MGSRAHRTGKMSNPIVNRMGTRTYSSTIHVMAYCTQRDGGGHCCLQTCMIDMLLYIKKVAVQIN